MLARVSHPAALRTRARALLLLAACAALGGCSGDPRPNLVLVTIDTLRADRVSAYGYELPTTPEIDALAAQGVLFERAIAASSATAPAHATMMTSLPVRRHTVSYLNGKTRLEGPTLASRLREAGWTTGAFVGNYMLQPRTGFDAGFDVFDSDLRSYARDDSAFFERQAEFTGARALEWIAGLGEEPFFLWLHLQDPHGPYRPPPAEQGRFTLKGREDEAPLPVLDDRYGFEGIPSYIAEPVLRYAREYEGRYADELHYADRWLGKVLRSIDAHPNGRDAVVLLTADHGEAMGEGGFYYVHSHITTPEIAHVPFVLRAPGIAPGRRGELASHLDVLPTLLELAGVVVPPEAQGLALGPYLREERALPERTVVCDMGLELAAYRGDRFQRVVNAAPALLDASAIPKRPEVGGPAGPSWGTSGADTSPYAGGHRPRWWHYRWAADGSFAPLSSADAALDPELLGYLSPRAARAVYNDDVEPEDLIRLRALGYW